MTLEVFLFQMHSEAFYGKLKIFLLAILTDSLLKATTWQKQNRRAVYSCLCKQATHNLNEKSENCKNRPAQNRIAEPSYFHLEPQAQKPKRQNRKNWLSTSMQCSTFVYHLFILYISVQCMNLGYLFIYYSIVLIHFSIT